MYIQQLKNAIAKLYDAALVLAPVASTRDALAERMENVGDTSYLLYQKIKQKLGYPGELYSSMEQSSYLQHLDAKQQYEWAKTQEMCEKESYVLKYVSDEYKTQEMYEKAVELNLYSLMSISSHFKTKDMCSEAVTKCLGLLIFVPDWNFTPKPLGNPYKCNYLYY